MPRKKNVLAAALCAGVVLSGVTGCGDSGQKSKGKASGGSSSVKGKAPSGVEKLPAEEIKKRSQKALASAGTIRMSSSGGGNDLRIDNAGNCAGTFAQEKYTGHLIKKGDEIWLKHGDAYWNDPASKPILAELPEARGKYLHGTVKESMGLTLMSMYCMAGEVLLSEKSTEDGGAALSKGAVTTVNGQKVVPLYVDSPKEGRSTAFVATEGRPYIVKAQFANSKEALFFSDFGKPFPPPASPPARETVDAAKVEELSMNAG